MESFYTATLSAGAILTGFCGTFLSFRLQREANYYRQVALDFETREARDVFVDLTHFTATVAGVFDDEALADDEVRLDGRLAPSRR